MHMYIYIYAVIRVIGREVTVTSHSHLTLTSLTLTLTSLRRLSVTPRQLTVSCDLSLSPHPTASTDFTSLHLLHATSSALAQGLIPHLRPETLT